MITANKTSNVLIVDDKPENLVSLEAILGREDKFNIIKASTGNEALQKLFKNDIAVVLLDVQMPLMNGFEVAEAIREFDRTKDVPIIFVTAISRTIDHTVKGYHVGANDYIVKPIDPDILMCKVNVFLELHEKRVSLEQEISRRQMVEEDLRNNKDKFQKLINSNIFSVLECDKSGQILNFNQAFCLLMDRERDFLSGFSDGLSQLLNNFEDFSGALVESGARGRALELVIDIAGVGERSILLGSVDIGEDKYICTLFDVTRQKELESMLFQSQKMEAIGCLAGGIAHDFNNLLTIMSGFTQIVMSELRGDPTNRDRLAQVCDAIENASLLTGQLLAFSRKKVSRPIRLDLRDLMEHLIHMLAPLLGASINVRLHFNASDLYVRFDKGLLEQVLMNLLINARDAMDGKGVVELVVDRINDQIVITVSDNGCGMDKVVLEKLFDPFFTTKEVGKGTGLGLSTVYGILQEGGGSIDVESVLNAGSTFTITLPEDVNGQLIDGASGVDDQDNVGVRVKSILLIEDEDDLRQMLCDALGLSGHEVHAFDRPSAAIAYVEAEDVDIDVILSDVIMPEMNGLDLVAILSKKAKSAQVILMSGYSSELINEEQLARDGIMFLSKPFSMASLQEILE